MRLEGGSQEGASQGKTKRIQKCTLRFLDTLGGQAGPSADKMEDIPSRDATDQMGKPAALKTGDVLIEWPQGYETDVRVMWQQTDPLPMTLLGIYPQFTTYDR